MAEDSFRYQGSEEQFYTGRQGDAHNWRDRVHGRQPSIHISNTNDSEDEFYDALENTQALHEANEKEVLNSPTLKLVERLYNNSAAQHSVGYSPENFKQNFNRERLEENKQFVLAQDFEEMESPAFNFFDEMSPSDQDMRLNTHCQEIGGEQILGLAFGQPEKERHSIAIAPKTNSHAREFGDNFFFIKKGGAGKPLKSNIETEQSLPAPASCDSSQKQSGTNLFFNGLQGSTAQIMPQKEYSQIQQTPLQPEVAKRGNSTNISSQHQISHFSLPSIQQESVAERPKELNSFFDFVAQKNVVGHSKLLPEEIINAEEAEDQASSTKSRKLQHRGSAAVTQSQIIYKQQQRSILIDPEKGNDPPIDFESSLSAHEEEVKFTGASGPMKGRPSLNRRQKQKIVQMQSFTYKKPYRELGDLQHLHNIQVSEKPIWVVKVRQDGKYLATGGLDGVLRVYQMLPVYYNERSTATLFNPGSSSQQIKPFKEFENAHQLDIFDISWCPKEPYENYLLTAGADMKVIIWNLNDRGPIQELAHRGIVSCAVFNISKQFCIASGCSDKTIRLWRINTRTVTNWHLTSDFITALQFNHNGSRLVAGLINGEVHIYDSATDSLQHLTKIECRNRTGKFSKGKKVTGIEFMSSTVMPNCIMVTTNDSRIRFINTKNGRVLLKVKGKGHKNENFMARGSLNGDFQHAICASEDGAVYLWNNIETTVLEASKRGLLGKIFKTNKVKEYEYFSMNQLHGAESMRSNLNAAAAAKRQPLGNEDSSGSSSNQSCQTDEVSASSSAFGSGNIALCQAVFAPKATLDSLNSQRAQNTGKVNMVIITANLRGEISVLMNQTQIAQL